ncbi:MAG: flavodoxin [Clostridium sp.]
MGKVCVINGSPRRGKSSSSVLVKELKNLFKNGKDIKEYFIDLINEECMDEILSNENIIFVSPLYVDSLPSGFVKFLKENEKKFIGKRIYGIVNCGFIEGHQNKNAIKILEVFCKYSKANWRFGVGVGGGEFMKASQSMPLKFFIKKPVYNAFLEIINDIESNEINEKNSIFCNARIPRSMFIPMGNTFWINEGKKYGRSKKEIKVRI